MMPIWALDQRLEAGGRLHWDGLNGSLREVLISSALGDGANTRTVDLERLDEMGEYLSKLAPPRFPLSVDEALAKKGEAVYFGEVAK